MVNISYGVFTLRKNDLYGAWIYNAMMRIVYFIFLVQELKSKYAKVKM